MSFTVPLSFLMIVIGLSGGQVKTHFFAVLSQKVLSKHDQQTASLAGESQSTAMFSQRGKAEKAQVI